MKLIRGSLTVVVAGSLFAGLSSMANAQLPSGGYCTDYAWGRFDAVASPAHDWSGNADHWFANAQAQGWQVRTSVTDVVDGSVVCWSGGGYGHVGWVVSHSNTGVTVMEKNWGITTQGHGPYGSGETAGQFASRIADGVTDKYGIVTTTPLSYSAVAKRGSYTFQGYILPTKTGPIPPGDTTPPSVSISTLANGAVVSGPITIGGSATDNVGATWSRLYVNGVETANSGSSFSFSWDPAGLSDGIYEFKVLAGDAAGNVGQSSVRVSLRGKAIPHAVLGADGYVEIFCRDMYGTPWHIRQDSQNGGFTSGWSSFGGTVDGNPIPIVTAGGGIQFFARGTDGIVYTRSQATAGGSWGSWGQLGIIITSTELAVGRNNPNGELQVFAPDIAGELLTVGQFQNGTWGSWDSFDNNINMTPAVAANENGGLELIAHHIDGSTWHKWQLSPNGAWSDWESFGGNVAGPPTIGTRPDGRLEFVVRGTDGLYYERWQTALNGSWSNWYLPRNDRVFASNPVIIRDKEGTLTVFGRGTDNAIYYSKIETNGWSAWQSLGGGVSSDPCVFANQDGTLQVVVRGTDGILYSRKETTTVWTWGGWTTIGDAVGRF